MLGCLWCLAMNSDIFISARVTQCLSQRPHCYRDLKPSCHKIIWQHNVGWWVKSGGSEIIKRWEANNWEVALLGKFLLNRFNVSSKSPTDSDKYLLKASKQIFGHSDYLPPKRKENTGRFEGPNRAWRLPESSVKRTQRVTLSSRNNLKKRQKSSSQSDPRPTKTSGWIKIWRPFKGRLHNEQFQKLLWVMANP